jgi:hypothetical protein
VFAKNRLKFGLLNFLLFIAVQSYNHLSIKQMFLKKLFVFLFILFSCVLKNTYGQGNNLKLGVADKDFEQKKYAEAYQNYEDILNAQHQYSESMLLKMAFIKEKENDIAATLYYLHLYYSKTTNEKVLQKIVDIAEANKYKGHKPSDIQFLFFLFEQYLVFILPVLLGLVFGLGAILFVRSRQGLDILFPTILLSLIALFFLYLYDFGKPSPAAIVKNAKAIAMDSPSAGALQIDILEKGMYVQVLDKKDIWYKIAYGDKTVFVRESNLWVIP